MRNKIRLTLSGSKTNQIRSDSIFYSRKVSFFNTFLYFRSNNSQSHEKTVDTATIFKPSTFLLQAQPVHRIRERLLTKNSRQPLEFINVMVLGLNKGGVTNAEGHFTIEQVPPGIYRLQATAIGYKSVTTPEYIVSTKDLNISIEMEENLTELAGVTVTASPFRRDLESPVSLRIIGLQEIEKSPGANRDISRIVQSYPGVAFSPIGYRNDLIVRGGSPSENRFYLDGVEIPNINHFSTQGASGGPVGILNADLIREVNFYTGAFPTDRGNALSSVLDFKLRDGDMEHNSVKGYPRSIRSLARLQRAYREKDLLSGIYTSILFAIPV